MSKSPELPNDDGPEIMTLEKARRELKDQIAKYKVSVYSDGLLTYEELEAMLLDDIEGLQMYVDEFNKMAREDWDTYHESDQYGVSQWVAEGGTDLSD